MKKLNILLILITLLGFACTDTLMDVAFDFKIDSIEDLARLRDDKFIELVASSRKNPVFYLVKNLDATDTVNWNDGEGWKPLWIPTNVTIDGRGYTITGLTINSSTDPLGLISGNQGIVKDLHLTNLTIDGIIDGSSYGAFADTNNGSIVRCSISGLSSGQTVGKSTSLYGAGFVLVNNGAIHNCFSRGSISGASSWGFVATNRGVITNCYSAHTLTCTDTYFKFSNSVNNSGTILRCYYDNDLTCTGTGEASDATGLTTSQMQDKTYFEPTSIWGFDDIWIMTDGSYPELR